MRQKQYKVVINESSSGEIVLSDAAVEWLRERGFEYYIEPNKYPCEYLNRYAKDYIPRHHPLLVECVETLGEEAGGIHDTLREKLKVETLQGRYYWIGNECMGDFVIDISKMTDAGNYNSHMTRKQRIDCFRDNLGLFALGEYPYRGEPQCYNEAFELEPEPPVPGGTKINVVNADCMEVARGLVREGYDVAILNMASRSNPGGGVENGSGAQEEQLCRRSNLILSLYQFDRRRVERYPRLGIVPRKEQYPMHPRFGGIYSPDVTFFREGEHLGLEESEEPFTASVISVAGIAHPQLTPKGTLTDADADLTKDKIRTILRIGMEHCHDALVLGALGCGAFGNPPFQIAGLFKKVLDEPEFKDQFRKIVFAILEDNNSRRNGRGGNFQPFRTVFEKHILREIWKTCED